VLSTLLPGVQHLQNIHPLIVHFPIALLPVAALFYLLAWLTGKENYGWMALWLLGLGVLGAAAAVASGLYGAEGVMVAPSVREHLLVNHERIMLGVLGLSIVAWVWALIARPMPRKGGVVFLILLAILSAGLSAGADFGLRMVYDYNAGGDACPQPIQFGQ
jgi:uncharacterized membrane protein